MNLFVEPRGMSGGGSTDRLANVTQTISRLLDGYDIRLRPNFGGMNIDVLFAIMKIKWNKRGFLIK